MKNCSVFASLISPSKMILFEKKYQTFDTVFHHQMKHLEVRQKYSAARRIFNSLLSVSSGDETLHLMFDILLPDIHFDFLYSVFILQKQTFWMAIPFRKTRLSVIKKSHRQPLKKISSSGSWGGGG